MMWVVGLGGRYIPLECGTGDKPYARGEDRPGQVGGDSNERREPPVWFQVRAGEVRQLAAHAAVIHCACLSLMASSRARRGPEWAAELPSGEQSRPQG